MIFDLYVMVIKKIETYFSNDNNSDEDDSDFEDEDDEEDQGNQKKSQKSSGGSKTNNNNNSLKRDAFLDGFYYSLIQIFVNSSLEQFLQFGPLNYLKELLSHCVIPQKDDHAPEGKFVVLAEGE